jgi:hypothetical protein
MNDVRPDVKSLFFEAIDQSSAEELRCFLDRVCANDAKLRASLERLLCAHRDAGNFLGGSSPAAVDQPRLEALEHRWLPGTLIPSLCRRDNEIY